MIVPVISPAMAFQLNNKGILSLKDHGLPKTMLYWQILPWSINLIGRRWQRGLMRLLGSMSHLGIVRRLTRKISLNILRRMLHWLKKMMKISLTCLKNLEKTGWESAKKWAIWTQLKLETDSIHRQRKMKSLRNYWTIRKRSEKIEWTDYT